MSVSNYFKAFEKVSNIIYYMYDYIMSVQLNIRSNHSKKGDTFMCDALYELFAALT